MKRTQIYFSYNQLDLLKQRAYEEKSSLSEVIRNLVKKYFEEENLKKNEEKEEKNAGDWLLSIAREAEKRKVKGPSDLSSRIDEYVYR